MLLSLAIFIPAIVLVMWRPRPFNEATAAALGAVALIIAGVVTPLQTWQVCLSNLNVLLFFLGLMVISTVADKAGIFEWLAHKVLFLAGGHGVLLLALLFALGTVITAFFSNDATALILTPIVFTLVSRLKLNALPYVFACAFTANTASMFLPVSNPVNLLAVDKFGLTLGSYLSHLLLPSILAIGVLFLLFLLVFRKTLTISSAESLYPGTVATDRFFICVSLGLFLTAAGYILVSLNGLPAAYPALGGALWMLACSFFFRRVKARQIYQGVSWSIFLFIIALAVLVKGLENGGVIQWLTDRLATLAAAGPLQALFSVTLGTALGSNLINNWSMMMVSVSSLDSLAAQSAFYSPSLVYAAIMGADLGPNLTILGSLSSMLWLVLLRKHGLNIHPMQYVKLGLIVGPLILIIGVLALYLCSWLWG